MVLHAPWWCCVPHDGVVCPMMVLRAPSDPGWLTPTGAPDESLGERACAGRDAGVYTRGNPLKLPDYLNYLKPYTLNTTTRCFVVGEICTEICVRILQSVRLVSCCGRLHHTYIVHTTPLAR